MIHETNYVPVNSYQVDAYRNSLNSQQQWLPDHRMPQSRQDWPQQPDLQQEMQPVLPQMRPDWPVRQMPPIQIPDKPQEKTQEQIVPKSKNEESTSVEDTDVYDDEDETKPTEPPKKKQRKHKNKSKDKKHGKENDEQPMHEQLQMIRKDLDMEFADHDGAAERPGGAVLSLTLGRVFFNS